MIESFDSVQIQGGPPPGRRQHDDQLAQATLLGSLLELGVDVDWADNHPEWDGKRLDLGYALDALMPCEGEWN